MGRKKVKFNKNGIEQLPNDKPVLYKIKTNSGNPNYFGVAKRGRVKERIKEHIGEIPGSMVEIEQFNNLKDAQKKETTAIKRSRPKYNKKWKVEKNFKFHNLNIKFQIEGRILKFNFYNLQWKMNGNNLVNRYFRSMLFCWDENFLNLDVTGVIFWNLYSKASISKIY